MKKPLNLKKAMVLLVAVIMLVSTVPVGLASSAQTDGKTYYVAADGLVTNDGLSEDKPMSFEKANAQELKGGDKILFKRGDIFYGCFRPVVSDTGDKSRVEVDAYGEGPLPIISNSKIVADGWQNAGNGFYKFDLTNIDNFKGIRDKSANVGFFTDAELNVYGRLMADAASCVRKYDFYCDKTYIYLKTDKDPYTDLGELKMAISGKVVQVDLGVNVSNLKIEYGMHGLCWKSGSAAERRRFSDVKNCVFDYIGGVNLAYDSGGYNRGGNGVEWFNTGIKTVIENNIFRNIYDVGFTCQGDNPGIYKNITIKNNVFAFNTQAMEFWDNNTNTDAGIYNLDFTNNLCVNNGESWALPSREGAINTTDLLIYAYKSPVWDVDMTENTFYHSYEGNNVAYYSHGNSVEGFFEKFDIDNNYLYFLDEDSKVFQTDAQGPEQYQNLTPNFKEWQEMTGFDKNSTFAAIGDDLDKYAEFEKIAFTSDNYHEIVKAAVDAGLTVKAEYDENLAVSESEKKADAADKAEAENSDALPMNIIMIAAVVVAAVVVLVVVIIVATGKKGKKSV